MLPIDGIQEDLDSTGRSSVFGLSPSAAAYLCACMPDPHRLVVVTPDFQSALTFASDLSFFLQPKGVCHLPPSERAPFEKLILDVETSFRRVRSLWALSAGIGPVVLSSIALAQPTLSPEALLTSTLSLRSGTEIDRDEVLSHLTGAGYRRVPVVTEVGEVAVRGGIIDLYSPADERPFRIELWGDEIQSIRTFDPQSQRSLDPEDSLLALPISEVFRDMETLSRGRQALSAGLSALGMPAIEQENILVQWDDGLDFPGISHFLPLIHGAPFYPGDYLSDSHLLVLLEPGEIGESLRSFSRSAQSRTIDGNPDPQTVYASPDAVKETLSRIPTIEISALGSGKGHEVRCLEALPAYRMIHPGPDKGSSFPSPVPDRFSQLARLLESEPTGRTVLTAHSPSALDRISSVLAGIGLDVARADAEDLLSPARGVSIVLGLLSGGFTLPDTGVTFISDADLFGPIREARTRGVSLPEWDLPIGTLDNGDIVVHIDHGIGRYEGLKQLDVADSRGDYLHLSFAGGDALYVPVGDMGKVQRYRSSAHTPPSLSKLGGAAWKRAKSRAKRSLKIMAGELLRLSAKRRTTPGYSFPEPDTMFAEFEASFPWTETPGQDRAIQEVLTDMTMPVPMDRLVCGDVGYGKTEVGLRAAFLAVLGGKQVAVLVPTTVLAQQHYQNFTERLKSFPVEVAMLSRFIARKEQSIIMDNLAAGKVDIVIGTHRLLSEDLVFKDLGLLIVDEEHRFGVRHKEKLKSIRETMDILTLSATPIPRTLFQAFSGLRNLSLIHTPPANRKAIHTEIRTFDEDLIRHAVNRELDRGGQVYIVHNRVLSIGALREMVQRLTPHARIGVAHGQMGERDLEKVMISFLKGEIDVLITTAIIESGIDITNANTLIINRADRFGLAQLYQLRGRVGRSPTLAYAYLLVPPGGGLSSKAKKRLASLRDLTELGSGFKLAAYDLEIRGAGNLLGEEQSGHIGAVGLDLFSQLLEQAVLEASGQTSEPMAEPSVKLEIPSFLPEEYLPDVGERLTLYKRISNARSQEELESLMEETADRFGRFTPEVQGLFARMGLILMARKLQVERIDIAGPYYILTMHPSARISPDALVALLSSDSRTHFVPPATLRLDVSGMRTANDRILYLKEILRTL